MLIQFITHFSLTGCHLRITDYNNYSLFAWTHVFLDLSGNTSLKIQPQSDLDTIHYNMLHGFTVTSAKCKNITYTRQKYTDIFFGQGNTDGSL